LIARNNVTFDRDRMFVSLHCTVTPSPRALPLFFLQNWAGLSSLRKYSFSMRITNVYNSLL